MTSASNEEPAWRPDPEFPDHPEFYRRALHYMPTPIVVVDAHGHIIYANQAMFDLGGWKITPDSDRNILNYIHPEDLEELAASFLDIVQNPSARIFGGGPWAEIYFRIVTADGSVLPIELVGSGGLMDAAVGGIIYEVRTARTRDLVGRVLDGLSQGASMHHLLSLVCEMIAAPPLDLEAAILQSNPDGNLLVAAASSPALSDIVRGHTTGMPWNSRTKTPARVDIATLPPELSQRFKDAGYLDLWHITVESPLTANTLRIVVAAATYHVPAEGPKNRLVRARELSAAVLLRSQADVLLEFAAGHDVLTGLPNRAAFHQRAEVLDPHKDRAAIHLDLDEFKHINADLGSATGDAVLQIIADRLRLICGDLDILGRVGDDEFAIMIGASNAIEGLEEHAAKLASQILSVLSETIVVAGHALRVTTSIGIAVAGGAISTDHLLSWAHAAMQDARLQGGGRVCRYGVALS